MKQAQSRVAYRVPSTNIRPQLSTVARDKGPGAVAPTLQYVFESRGNGAAEFTVGLLALGRR